MNIDKSNKELNTLSYRLIKERAKNRAVNSKLDALDSIITNTLQVLKHNKTLTEENHRLRKENANFRTLLLINNIDYETDNI